MHKTQVLNNLRLQLAKELPPSFQLQPLCPPILSSCPLSLYPSPPLSDILIYPSLASISYTRKSSPSKFVKEGGVPFCGFSFLGSLLLWYMEIMDSQEQKRRDKYHEEEEEKLKQGSKAIQQAKQQPQQASPPEANSAASPPSPTSSPSHEFSFTISLQPSSVSTSTTSKAKSTTSNIPADKSKSSPASFALDLSPADEIFFHGHLLPLHLLSHLPVSPRSSTNSMDSFTLPINDLHDQNQRSSNSLSTCNAISSEKISNDHHNHTTNRCIIEDYEMKGRSSTKSKSFSLFGLSSKWRKENVAVDTREKEDKERQKRKLKFDHVSHVLKRYIRMVRPLLSFGNRRGNHVQFHRQAYSYSGNLSLRRKPELIGRRGEFSAPASMRTSPTNSGLLVATGTLSPSCSKSDSTMEELQAAIQAAITHCKNSIAMEEKIKCHE